MPEHKYPNWPFCFGPGLEWLEEQERKKQEKKACQFCGNKFEVVEVEGVMICKRCGEKLIKKIGEDGDK